MTESAKTLNALDIEGLRKEFPILDQQINNHPLVYFDNAATSQKPRAVIRALTDYYSHYNANIHRGIHTLAEKATHAFEDTRKVARQFINAPSAEEVIFTRGTTESINLVASAYGRAFLTEGDEVVISALEHHSNIVPWQLICQERKAVLKVIPVSERGEIELDALSQLITGKTKIIAINHASNSLGTINPVETIIKMGHDAGAVVLIDGAQAGAHLDIDVQKLNCDFYCLSAHKMYGPTGAGILYGKRALLEQMPPYQAGGEMISNVTFDKTTYNELPYKFEAGTPNIADVVAFKSAMEFILALGRHAIHFHEQDLLTYATRKLQKLERLRIIGQASQKVAVVSFVIEGVHPFDIGQMLDARGVAVRTGHHCTQPLMDRLGLEGTVRASFAVYNTRGEIDQLAEGLERIINFMHKL